MVGLDGVVYGNCQPDSGDDFECTTVLGLGFDTQSGVRMFRCVTDITAE